LSRRVKISFPPYPFPVHFLEDFTAAFSRMEWED
jgi:hypothetical protein